jgi:threonylcarbamoyladenosine tRNA methylthiotransferase MtaB
MNKYATAVTIGCRLNQADTALIFDVLRNMEFEIVPQKTDKALSVIIINTCSVTASASQKSRQAARSMKNKYPNSFVIVTGCSIETEKDTWAKEECIDLFIPNADKSKIADYLLSNKTFKKNFLDNDKYRIMVGRDLRSAPKGNVISDNNYDNDQDNKHTGFEFKDTIGFYPYKCRANLKIQEGCDSFCTYCIVPYGRGKPRSRNLEDTLREFKELLKRGHKEIVLTGVNIAMYNDSGEKLVNLLEELIKVPGEFRIRLSSTEPQFNNHGLIDIIASTDKICNFLHLPLQHGSNEILKKMNRNYTAEDFSVFVNEAVSKIPNICIGTDIITGFPGETDELFNTSKEFVEKLPLAYMHVFKYSKRKGTPAAEYIDQIPNIVSSKRHKELSLVSSNLDQNYLNTQIKKTIPVLFERQDKKGDYIGWSDNYVKVKVLNNNISDKNTINQIIQTEIIEVSGNRELIGKFKNII